MPKFRIIFYEFDQVGFCLDTRHAHAAGLGLDGLVDRVRAITGRIDVVHCNDSRDVEGKRRGHANLGEGFADADALVALVRAADTWTILRDPRRRPGARARPRLARERLA